MNSNESVVQIVEKWRRDVETATEDLREHASRVAEMPRHRRRLTELLLVEDESTLHLLLNLMRRIRQWEPFDDHDTSRVQGKLCEHLHADRNLADAVCDVLDLIRIREDRGT
ncbi:MAG: hypothetical protein FJ286_10740 [Planctomycetes bacterium]|nr:hypothetical protein [Planctomycetota bacterium]